jgi:hypothetical protein
VPGDTDTGTPRRDSQVVGTSAYSRMGGGGDSGKSVSPSGTVEVRLLCIR